MDRAHWLKVKEIFGAAMEAGEADRDSVVASLCEGDSAVEAEVRSLLDAHRAAERVDWDGPRPAPPPNPRSFSPIERFTVDTQLGSGGFGVVYRAWDTMLERWVALKTLRQHAPGTLVRFKSEFRALADLSHPNLLKLFELFVEGEQTYFSMELVENGRHVVDAADVMPSHRDPGRRPRWQAVTNSFLQLADGVRALHGAGVLHRDLKPSNVLITRDGRVVILDFGLATGIHRVPSERTSQLMGTPAYMAPEQFAGAPASEASDWYAVGVMLWEALSARPYPSGTHVSPGMSSTSTEPAADPALFRAALPADVPSDLGSLCFELLAADPGRRPGGAEIVDRLKRRSDVHPGPSTSAPTPSDRRSFVGREAQIAALDHGFIRACGGALTVVCVHGPSGFGKTALVREFLTKVRQKGDGTVIFTARCHEREALGFKAVDGIVDGLSQYLNRLQPSQAAALLPANPDELARLFPVLLQCHAFSTTRRRLVPATDSIEQRRQAFRALRELLTRVAHETPLILFIDDLHWGDMDSAALLRDLVRPPDGPPLLLIVACRDEELATPTAMASLEALRASAHGVEDIAVLALSAGEVRALAQEEFGDAERLVQAIVREAGGIPMFVHELLEEARRAPARLLGETRTLELDTVLAHRVERLSVTERALLEVISLAGRPVERRTARRAAVLDSAEAHDAERSLIATKLVRMAKGGQLLDTYHSRIREVVARLIDGRRAEELHRGLAEGLMAAGGADPEDLAYHLLHAGLADQAADAAARGALRWTEVLAFARAAGLYRLALDLRPADHPDVGRLLVCLASALVNAGRGAEAAIAFLEAADRLPEQRLSLRCKAAEQLLQSGEVRRGRAIVTDLLRNLGWSVPERPSALLASILFRRFHLSVRGLHFEVRSQPDVAEQQLVRLDGSWALVSGLSLIDTVRANYFQNHHLLSALSVGEPRRLLRALAAEAAYCCMPGSRRSRKRADAVLGKLRTLAADHPSQPTGKGMVAIGTSMAAWMFGDWTTCQSQAAEAERVFREQCTGVAWELGTARTFMLGTLTFIGDYLQYERHWPVFADDARARRDVFAETKLVLVDLAHAACLARDAPDEAISAVDRALGMWDSNGFHLQHFWALFAKAEIAIYRGDPAAAWSLLENGHRDVKRSLLLRVQTLRVWLKQLRLRAVLALAHQSPERRQDLLRRAATLTSSIERERTPWGNAMVPLFRGIIQQNRGNEEGAAVAFDNAATALQKVNMYVYAAVAKRAQALLVGGAQGAILVKEAEGNMMRYGVKVPERLARLMAPAP